MGEIIKWFLEILKMVKIHKLPVEQIFLLEIQNWA
jgi:hypothetical protein